MNKISAQIDHIKSQISEGVKRVSSADILKNKTLAELAYNRFKKEGADIPYAQLQKLPRFQKVPLPSVEFGGILSENISTDFEIQEGIINTFNVWSVGATLPWHYHSDCKERIRVIKGSCAIMLENANGDLEKFTLSEGDIFQFAEGIKHQTTALESLEMEVMFFWVDINNKTLVNG